jgi:hypothetical protein
MSRTFQLKSNRSPSSPDNGQARVGVAGVVRAEAVQANAFLANYADDEPSQTVYRRELHDGRPHIVVPVIMAIEGVLNEALVPQLELEKSVPVWNGRPVVLLHPEEMGVPISASAYPDVFERRVGTVFGAFMDGKRLKAELWLDEKKMDHLGASDLMASMKAGEIVEVSTSYFSDDIVEQSEFNGIPYVERHTNLRPDHLALLPDEVGACSIADGCGAPRINSGGTTLSSKIREALSTISKAIGIHTNGCDCQECLSMNKLAQVKAAFEKHKLFANQKFLIAVNSAFNLADASAFKVNKALESKHLKMLEDMDEGQLDMMRAMIEAYKATDPAAAAEEEEVEEVIDMEEETEAMKANRKKAANEPITLTKGKLDALIANAAKAAVAEYAKTEIPLATRRAAITEKLKANTANPFSDEQLSSLPVDALEATEAALRPADYSGYGGFPVHQAGDDHEDEPLAVVTNARQAEAADARSKRRASTH